MRLTPRCGDYSIGHRCLFRHSRQPSDRKTGRINGHVGPRLIRSAIALTRASRPGRYGCVSVACPSVGIDHRWCEPSWEEERATARLAVGQTDEKSGANARACCALHEDEGGAKLPLTSIHSCYREAASFLACSYSERASIDRARVGGRSVRLRIYGRP